MGEKTCRYGIVHLPVEEYFEQERIWIEAMKERENPFTAPRP
jgi:hypothetical protein